MIAPSWSQSDTESSRRERHINIPLCTDDYQVHLPHLARRTPRHFTNIISSQIILINTCIISYISHPPVDLPPVAETSCGSCGSVSSSTGRAGNPWLAMVTIDDVVICVSPSLCHGILHQRILQTELSSLVGNQAREIDGRIGVC